MIADNGILLSANPDEEEVANAIQRILTLEESDLHKAKAAAYRKWQEEFDADKSFDRMYQILNKRE